MDKTVRKHRFLDVCRIGETESWLTDMAARGLHLLSLGLVFARFEHGESANIRYRIEFSQSEQRTTAEQIELYAESGWEHVCDAGEMRVFRSPEENHAPEIHTDPAEQAYTLEKLSRRLTMNTITIAIMMAAAICMLGFAMFLSGTPLLSLVEGQMMTAPIIVLLYIYIIFSQIRAAISIKNLIRSMKEGRSIEHRANWSKHKCLTVTAFAILGVLTPLCVGSPIAALALNHTETLPVVSDNQMHLRLADIEKNDLLVRGRTHMIRGVDWANHSTREWSLYAPVILSISENGSIPDKMWPDGSGEYSPGIEVKLYKLRFSGLAEGVLDDLCKKYADYSAEPIIDRTGQPGFDGLFVRSDNFQQDVFASKDEFVILVRYYGEKDVDSVVQAVEALMENTYARK